MDLRSIKLHFVDGHIRAVVVDAAGERATDLEGESARPILAAAASLVGQLERRGGAGASVRALSLDFVDRLLRASLAGAGQPALRLDGAELEALAAELRPIVRAFFLVARPRVPDPPGSVSTSTFWSRLYQIGGDGWELGRAAPPLARWFTSHPPVGQRVLVPGCGRGHEARMLATLGAQVTGIDIAEEAIADAARRAAREGVTVDFRVADLFALPTAPERYQLLVEHTCFCAVDPARRAEYAAVAHAVLAPGGAVVGLFWNLGRAGGPPFSVTREELIATFEVHFTVEHFETPPDSVASRQGAEMLVVLRRR